MGEFSLALRRALTISEAAPHPQPSRARRLARIPTRSRSPRGQTAETPAPGTRVSALSQFQRLAVATARPKSQSVSSYKASASSSPPPAAATANDIRENDIVMQIDALTSQMNRMVRENEAVQRRRLEQKEKELNSERESMAEELIELASAREELDSERQERQKLKKRVDELNAQVKCVVCMQNERCVVFQPCFHMVACQQCQSNIQACPICRAEVEGHLKVRLV